MDISKDELKKLYIDERKTIQKISNIYKCHRGIIERKLKKYEIDIRPRGSFLVDDDGEFLKSKYNKGKISGIKYKNEWAKSKGFKDNGEYENERIKSKGFKNYNDYLNEWTKSKGFKNNADYQQKMRFKKSIGSGLSMYENKNSSQYLGIVIAERILPKIFNDVKMMSYGNEGFDIICNKNLKIEVKCSTLHKSNQLVFSIKKNKIADYFLMIAFNNRDDLNVMHMWLVKGNAVIEKTNINNEEFILNEKQVVTIRNGIKSLKRYEQYEMTNKLDDAQKICDEFKMKQIKYRM